MRKKNCFCDRPLTTVLMTCMSCSRCKADGRLPVTWVKFSPIAYRLDDKKAARGSEASGT